MRHEIKRLLVSSGYDGIIYFWSYDSNTLALSSRPKKIVENDLLNTSATCISFSYGIINTISLQLKF